MEALVKLQKNIFKLLNDDKSLKRKISGIFSHVPQETRYPYIYLNNFKCTGISSKNKKISFEVMVFNQEANNKKFFSITGEYSNNCVI